MSMATRRAGGLTLGYVRKSCLGRLVRGEMKGWRGGGGIETADGDGDENNGRDADAEMGRRRGTRVRALGDYIMVRRWMSCVLSIQPPAPLFVS